MGSSFDIGIIGAGAWGTTLAALAGKSGKKVALWAFETETVDEINQRRTNSIFLKLSEFRMPPSVEATGDFAVFAKIPRLIIAVPSAFFPQAVIFLAPHVKPDARLLSAVKGFIGADLRRPTQLLEELLPDNPRGALCGPNLAMEIASGLPAITLVASQDDNLAREFQSFLSAERFRVYTGSDVAGTELGGSLKNIMAIAAGMAFALRLGENALAGLITRGLAEMIKLGKVLGAQEKTFFGISGLGDLICTSQSVLSRNHQVGQRIASGEKLDAILAGTHSIAEGVDTTRNVHSYAQSHGLDLPITRSVHNILFENVPPEQEIRALMTRAPRTE
jgi:glycerol-3-phosphate dehydrogenase (NAD(P)+)